MSIITISRGSYSKGKAIAEKLAAKLGYKCLARDVIIEASKDFNIPEVKLIRALHNSPSILDRFTYGREKYIAYIRRAFLHQIKEGNIIYHGLAGQFFLKDVPGILKVRIIANMDTRIQEEMKREKISSHEAEARLKKDDEERRKWSMHLYGIDTRDSSLYDLVLHIDNINEDEAVEIIERVSTYSCFQITSEIRKIIEDRYLEAWVQSMLINQYPTVNVNCDKGKTTVSYKDSLARQESNQEEIRKILAGVEGLTALDFNVEPIVQPD